jgi:hypothetical protein
MYALYELDNPVKFTEDAALAVVVVMSVVGDDATEAHTGALEPAL